MGGVASVVGSDIGSGVVRHGAGGSASSSGVDADGGGGRSRGLRGMAGTGVEAVAKRGRAGASVRGVVDVPAVVTGAGSVCPVVGSIGGSRWFCVNVEDGSVGGKRYV